MIARNINDTVSDEYEINQLMTIQQYNRTFSDGINDRFQLTYWDSLAIDNRFKVQIAQYDEEFTNKKIIKIQPNSPDT
jgi:hypothetical protein